MQLPYANLELRYQNEGASKPLILPVHLICNTSDEQIYENIRINSHNHNTGWVKCEDAHDGIAIIVGSAPSMLDTLDDIRAMQDAGGKIFALNNAANVLYDNGIFADYQVMIDARIETAELIAPAKVHLFGSQVHPECFRRCPDATLWHLQVGNIEDYFPEYDDAYALIGGAASVGNTATCLAYAMGYRDLQIFGMDSSHKDGVSHAKHQSINDGDPCAWVTYNGKQYLCSLTMKLQAERFQETSKALQDEGAKITVHGYGLLPDMWRLPPDEMSEVNKYTLMWNQPEYREVSPGELCAKTFIDTVKPSGRVIDYGCGTGRGSLKIKESGCDVLLVDFTENSRDYEAKSLPFLKHDLTKPLPGDVFSKYGFCTDVMEHINPDDVEGVIRNIMDASEVVFFNISTIPDVCGDLIGQQLHLTVKPHSWWKELFAAMDYNVSWDEERSIASLFIVKKRR